MYLRRTRSLAFTLLETLAAVAIIAVLLTVMVPQVANFVATAQRESDKRTLTVLNDALNRYKTQGGDLNALTQGARIQNILTKLQATISWNGMTHQVMRGGQTFPAHSIGGLGEKKQYKFIKYKSYFDSSADTASLMAGAISLALANRGASISTDSSTENFNSWLASAIAQTASTNYLALKNPSSTSAIGFYLATAQPLRIWWGDGTTNTYSNIPLLTPVTHSYTTPADRAVVIVGNLTHFAFNGELALGGIEANRFEGDISTMTSLGYINALAGNHGLSGDIGRLQSITTIQGLYGCSGNIADLPISAIYIGVGGNSSQYTYHNTPGLRNWPNTMSYFYVNSATLTSAMKDALLIDLANANWSGLKQVHLLGPAGSRTSASDSAIATLTSKGVAVSTN